MPILQSRVISILNAAIDIQHGLDKLIRLTQEAHQRVRKGEQDAMRALDDLAIEAQRHFLLINEAQSIATIALEARHFKTAEKKNNSSAKRQRRRRGQSEDIETRSSLELAMQPIPQGFTKPAPLVPLAGLKSHLSHAVLATSEMSESDKRAVLADVERFSHVGLEDELKQIAAMPVESFNEDVTSEDGLPPVQCEPDDIDKPIGRAQASED